jgi:DNA-directed RNA polymerase subunit RPC12/RpoP
MPTLACQVCGRVVETTKAPESLSAEERRCPRCGSTLDVERRSGDRRQGDRRTNPNDSPGPPGGTERRVADRRQGPRRRQGGMSPGG